MVPQLRPPVPVCHAGRHVTVRPQWAPGGSHRHGAQGGWQKPILRHPQGQWELVASPSVLAAGWPQSLRPGLSPALPSLSEAFDKQQANTIFWSPQGQFVVLAGLRRWVSATRPGPGPGPTPPALASEG